MNPPRRGQAKNTTRSQIVRLRSPKEDAREPEVALHLDMVAFGKKLSKDPSAARDFLRRAGIVKRDGTLAKAYGG